MLDVLIEDSATGKRAWSSSRLPEGFDAWWWTEGNGSCDCNRELVVYPENEVDAGECLGCNRFYIVETRGDTEGRTLSNFNEGYPPRASLVKRG